MSKPNKNNKRTIINNHKQSRVNIFKKMVNDKKYQRNYLIGSVIFLIISTVIWAGLSARVHSNNADQLVNPYLYESSTSFGNSTLPGQHSQFLKWPVFYVIHLFGDTARSYQVATIILALATVLFFCKILYKIEKRPLVIGTIFLALASVLLQIPAQPYAGALLPVNMGMATTRNIEYVLYIASILALLRSPKIKHRLFLVGVIGLSILIASDALFFNISLGGALIALFVYALSRRWNLVTTSARWILGVLAGAAGSYAILGLVSAIGVVNFSSQSTNTYNLASSLHQLVLGIIYGVSGLLVNFGANFASDTNILSQFPKHALANILSYSGPALLINFALFIVGIVAVFMIIENSLRKHGDFGADINNTLSVAMIWSTVAALGAFVITNHYYAGDARYLSIALFTIFIAGTTYLRKFNISSEKLVIAGYSIALLSFISMPAIYKYNRLESSSTDEFTFRNSVISQILNAQPVSVLIGDYWRVLPIKQVSKGKVRVLPLSDCTTYKNVLTSSEWQMDLKTSSFAYLLSVEKGQTDFPGCSINTVISKYGEPNSSIVVSGTVKNPKELLLFYDYSVRDRAIANNISKPTTSAIVPTKMKNLTNTPCTKASVLNIVAHQDDDILFMNPDIQKYITAGLCVRTVYLTTGDGGNNSFYWLRRERGSEAAYSKMAGIDNFWVDRTVELDNGHYITASNPVGNDKILLLYMHLPDGNLRGGGFKITNNESIEKLYNDSIPSIKALYGDSTYSTQSLTDSLLEIMATYHPSFINTLSDYNGTIIPDHSDHIYTSKFVDRSYEAYMYQHYANILKIPIKHYIGYPVRQMDENVTGAELDSKFSTFLTYSKYDGAVCKTVKLCRGDKTYGTYLHRQYTSN